MHTYHLTLHNWAAFSSGRNKPDLPTIPAMLRRRLSSMGKAALWCANEVLEANTGPVPVTSIFCSQHGEVSRTVAMLESLAEQSPLSPASFSLSVHNAIGGIYSIAGNIESPITAIAAGPDSPFAALLEAWSQLKFRQMQGQPAGRALCVIYDDGLPDVVADPENHQGDVQSLALLLSCEEPEKVPGDALTLSFTLTDEPGAGEDVAEGAAIDVLLKFLVDETSRDMFFRGDGRFWSWHKHENGALQVPL